MSAYHRFCSCGGSILTLEQMETDQLCQRCREEQIRDLKNREVKKEET
jgi:NADH pyrophosphatase NudC (nudix superfamily)